MRIGKFGIALLLLLSGALAGCVDEAQSGNDTDSAVTNETPGVENEQAPEPQPAAVPHVHDYWAGRGRVTLLDEDFTVDPPEALMWGVMTTLIMHDPAVGGAFVSLPEGAIVYEGTGRLEMTVTWTDSGITGMRFLHRHAGSGDIQPWTETPNGETITIEVTPDMTDMPHATASRWGFLFTASGTPQIAVGTFHITMEIVKTREVEEWPAHPDLWQGRTQILLAEAEATARSHVGPAQLLESDPWAEPEDAIPSEAVVPMGASMLRVNVTVLDVNPDIEVEDLRLLVRTANDIASDFDSVGDAVSVSEDGRTWSWEVPVTMQETDNPYADTSAWAFRVVASYLDLEPGLPTCEHGCYEAELRYALTATVEQAQADETS